MLYIDVFFCTAAAWYAAELFIRLPPKNAAVDGATVGLLCALLAFLLPAAGWPGDWTLAVFLLLGLIVPVQKRVGWADRALAFPLWALWGQPVGWQRAFVP